MSGEDSAVALVTGAASAIGACICDRLRARGWRVAGVDLGPSESDLSLELDVADRAAMRAAVDRAVDELGAVSLLVTAAGAYETLPAVEIDPGRWRRMLAVQLGGVVNACWAVVPGMLAARSGTIVTISSELAIAGGRHASHYSAAKGAVIGFTRSLGLELAPRGVRVNSVAPGPTDTPLLPPDLQSRSPDYMDTLPLGRLVTPAEVAETVVMLVEEGTYFAGQTLSPNAGAVI